MIEKGDKILVAVSGGPDSIALLNILHEMKEKLKIELCVAHLNHNVRGEASHADEEFVRSEAQKLDLPFFSKTLPKSLFRAKGSKEELMRNKRYEFLLEAAKKFKANKIALAHTRDDQAETVLMRLIKGSGLRGLSGIPPVRVMGGVTLIRPLIEISKKDLMAYLKKKGLSFRKDITNRNLAYLRNSIRHKLIPFIERNYNPDIKETLFEISDIARGEDEYLEQVAWSTFKKCLVGKIRNPKCEIRNKSKIQNSKIILSYDKFNKLPVVLKRRVVRLAIKQAKGDLRRVEFRHLKAIEELLNKKSGKVDLPCGVVAEVNSSTLTLMGTVPINTKETRWDSPQTVPIKAEIFNNGWVKKNLSRIIRKKNKLVEYFDYDKLSLPFRVRFRKPGDKIRPFGIMNAKGIHGTKPLKELFIDEKVDRNLRNRTPLVVSGRDIIWAAGVRRSSVAPVTDETKKVLKLSLVNGFSLLGVLIGIAIITTVVIATMSAFVAASKAVLHSKTRIAALHFAKETAERLKNYVADPYLMAQDTTGKYRISGIYPLADGSHDDPAEWGDFKGSNPSRKYTVEPLPNGCKKVTIEVKWDEPERI